MGRMPKTTSPPRNSGSMRAADSPPSSMSKPLPLVKRRTRPEPPRSRMQGMKFMGGSPMNLATNMFAGWLYSSPGVPYCCTTPRFMTAMRSDMARASSWSWVTYTVVMPSTRCRRASSPRVRARRSASRCEMGSSISSTELLRIRARAMPTRCFSPPPRLTARVFSRPSRSSSLLISWTFFRISCLSTPRRVSGKAMLS